MKVSKKTVSYGGWPNCIRLSDGRTELIATTDVGPRIIRYARIGGPNVFKEYTAQMGTTGGKDWRIYGGHRLWHAPEVKPRTYHPDNKPIDAKWRDGVLTLDQGVESTTGLQKTIEVGYAKGGQVWLVHRLTNHNAWEVEFAPWCLTVMAAGGRAIFPNEDFVPHTEYLLPARPMVMWHYTNMADPRWTWGTRYVQLRQDVKATCPQKVGFLNTKGWAAYTLGSDLFIKRYAYDPLSMYADLGCNTETFTNEDMIEVETLGPLTRLAPGASVEHLEAWSLEKVTVGEDEADIAKKVEPRV